MWNLVKSKFHDWLSLFIRIPYSLSPNAQNMIAHQIYEHIFDLIVTCMYNLWKSPTSSCERDLSAGCLHVPLEQGGRSQRRCNLTSGLNHRENAKMSYLDSRAWFSPNFWSWSLCPASLTLCFLRRNDLHQELEIDGDHSYRVKGKHHCNTAIKRRWRLK